MKKLFLILMFLCCCSAAFAEKPEDKELNDTVDVAAGLPLSVDDASVQEYYTWSSQFATHFQHGGNEEKSVTISPQLQYGLLHNVEISFGIPYTLESIDGSHGNNLGGGIKYNFLPEEGNLPALAVEQDISLPTAANSAGVNTTTQFLLTKHILHDYGTTAFYLNASWNRYGRIDDEDRRNSFSAATGFSHSLSRHTAVVADLVEEQLDEKDKDATLAELGFRQFINKDLIASIGTGTGLNHDAPDFEFNAGLEYGF